MEGGTWYETDDPQFAPAFRPRHAPRFLYGASGRRAAVTSGGRHQVFVLDDGELALEIREARPRTPMPETIRAATRFEQPDSLPAYSDLAVDGSRRVWLASAAEPGGLRQWRIFGTDGAPEGFLTLPDSETILDALGGRVLVGATDSLGVEVVRLHRLQGDRFRH